MVYDQLRIGNTRHPFLNGSWLLFCGMGHEDASASKICKPIDRCGLAEKAAQIDEVRLGRRALRKLGELPLGNELIWGHKCSLFWRIDQSTRTLLANCLKVSRFGFATAWTTFRNCGMAFFVSSDVIRLAEKAASKLPRRGSNAADRSVQYSSALTPCYPLPV